ncbi:MAG: recombinase RecA [Candidatus Methanoperedens sp.]|nr:recombinase RecA [Candidatus Methanoperedens sp.]
MKHYAIEIKELDETIEGIKNGSNIMIISPPMSGKEAVLDNIMYHRATKNETALIIVTTNEPAFHILERFKKKELELSLSRIGMVDCISKNFDEVDFENAIIKTVNSPADLTSIGVRIGQFIDDFSKKGLKIQIHINSLSTILMYSNNQTVFRFLHNLTGRIKAAEALGIFVIGSGMHDKQTIATLKQFCDCLVEIKSENNINFIRIIGQFAKSTPWFEYEFNDMCSIISN